MITYSHSVSYIKNSNSLFFALDKGFFILYLCINFSGARLYENKFSIALACKSFVIPLAAKTKTPGPRRR